MPEPFDQIAERYELLAPLGEGGMGVVWRARDIRLGRFVAVKLLSAAAVGSETARGRLIREARAAAALEHDGIIRVYDVGELPDGGAFLVMELVRGKSLRDELAEGPLDPARSVRIIAQVARSLQFAHESGVVHRDVKPDNIMLRDGDRAIVVDFGVAKPVATEIVANAETLAGMTNTTLTGIGQIVGTPAYLSPEQARGPDVSAATDQFALAVTAFETMTGHRPWTGKTVVELLASLLRDAPASLRALLPDAPDELERVLARALSKEPGGRFTDIAAFGDALEKAAADLPVSARSSAGASSVTSSMKAPTVSTNGGQSTTPVHAAPTKRRGTIVVLGIAALLAIGLLATKMWPSARPESTPARGAARSNVVACPPFAVVGIDAPWLGAAAATLACERMQIARGGVDTSTLTPADLAGAPREITPGFPAAMFDPPTSRDSGVAAARRSARWLDGKLEKQVDAYVATIVLHGEGDAELARGEGRAVEMFEAIRDAIGPIIRASPAITTEERAQLRDWLDVDSVEAALALLDVRTAILIEDVTSIRSACSTLESRHDLAPRTLYLARSACRKRLRTGPTLDAPPAIDESTPGALITTSLAHGTTGGPAAVRERAQKLEQARDRAASAEGKARLAAAAAEIYNLIGDERARDVARSAILSSPKAVDWRASAWHRVAFSSAGDASLAAAIATWHPWEPVAQSVWGARGGHVGNGEAQSLSIQRAYLLSRRGPYANAYGTDLLERGNIEAARSVAELARDDLLRVEIMLAEARYGAVLVKVRELLEALPANDESASLAFRLAYQGVRAGVVLERPADFVDIVVSKYVLSEPHHVIDGVAPVISLLNACVLAPRAIGRRCIGRLEELRRGGRLPTIFSTIETVLAGASRFVADDYDGAVRSWRTLLRASGWVQGPLREPLAIAFERAGEPELADEVEAPVIALVDLPRTADMAWVRGAKRAHKRGDDAQARKLAAAVVEKWRFADEKVPATHEMKELLAKLPPGPR